MNLDLIRYTDKYLGIPLRLFLYYYQKLRDLFPQRESHEPYRRILVVKFWGIGNIIRVSPTLEAIRKRFPEAEITFITLIQNRGIYEGGGLFDEAIYLELKSVWAFLWDVFRKYFTLRRKQFDLVLNLEPLANFPEIVSFYVAVGARVGFTVPGRRSLFTIKVPFKEDEHISQTFFRILYPFGVQMPEVLLPIALPLSQSEQARADELLLNSGIDGRRPLIAFNVNASEVADARRWPPENFAELARRLRSELDADLIFIGAPNESQRVAYVINETGAGASLAGKTTIKQAAAVLAKAGLFITNDSGPMHLAMAMGAPTVALFGPESPIRYGPISNHHTAIYKGYDCSPCINFAKAKKIRCKHHQKCIRDITVDQVFQEAVSLYRRTRKNRA